MTDRQGPTAGSARRTRRMRTMVAAVVTVAVLAAGSQVAAAPGDLDGGFGSGGVVGPLTGTPSGLAEADGAIYVSTTEVSGDGLATVLRVRRLTAAGAADASFGTGGTVTLDVDGVVGSVAVAVDATGRVVVAADVLGAEHGYGIWRFSAGGVVDPAFGTGGVAWLPAGGGRAKVTGLGIQPDGDVVVGIADTFVIGGLAQLPGLVRLTSTGAVAQEVDVEDDHLEGGSLAVTALDAAGRVYVLVPNGGSLAVRRYTEALSLDASYGSAGSRVVRRPGGGTDDDTWGGALHVSADGTALVTGTVGPGVEEATLVARIGPAGALDPTFSDDGIALLARPSGVVRPIGVGPAASGGVAVAADRFVAPDQYTSVAWELTAAGAPEPAFSGDGRVERPEEISLAITASGGARLLVAGYTPDFTGTHLAAISLTTPAPATVPGAPGTPTVTAASGSTAVVAWTAPASTGGSALTGYDLLVYEGASDTPAQTVVLPAAPTQATVGGLAAGTLYRFEVVAANAVGQGPASASSAYALPPFTTVSRFVRQQYVDFTAKEPTAAQLSDLRTRVEDGTTTPVAAIVEVAARPEHATLDGLTRIYHSYFTRVPDRGGLRYWLGRRRAGVSISRISDQFVASNEFKNTYGSLSNRAFVDLVYQNVLDRAGDPNGADYWTSQLDRRVKGRATVMLLFSESSEHLRRRAGQVNLVSATFAMLDRAPTSDEVAAWVPQLQTSKEPVVAELLASEEYDARIPPS